MIFATILLLALTRAEIIERMRAPVVTQADGLVQVYADCPEDMRREFQSPIARFASDTVTMLYRGANMRAKHFAKPGIIIHIGDVRTNLTTVTTRVVTNRQQIVTRVYAKSPGHADLDQLRVEIIKAFFRTVMRREVNEVEAIAAYRQADPRLRIHDRREGLERWLAGKGGDDEENLKLMRMVMDPGHASKRDVLTFASRLYLYPPQQDLTFANGSRCLSFKDAISAAVKDPNVRLMAALKANELGVFGGGRGEEMLAAATAFSEFLRELARGEKTEQELLAMYDEGETKLALAMEKIRQ